MIQVEHLTKCYGDVTAVDDLSFEIEGGHVYGFLGPNGAGKSTTMNIMTGCLSATKGSVKIDGFDIFEEPAQAKKRIGYLPEQPPLYMNETPAEYLRFVGEAKGLKRKELHSQIDSVIGRTGLDHVRNRRISALSKGYKQRVGIAQALLGDPKVVILDEPTVGLDPLQIIEIRDLIKDLGREHTVIFSSHILSEVQTICEKILLSPGEITLVAEADARETEELLSGMEHITEQTIEEKEIGRTAATLHSDCEDIYEVSKALFKRFSAAGKPLLEMNVKKADLEEIFIELTESAQTEDIKTEESEAGEEEMA